MTTPLACTPAKEVQPEQTTNTVPPEREIEADMMNTQEEEEEEEKDLSDRFNLRHVFGKQVFRQRPEIWIMPDFLDCVVCFIVPTPKFLRMVTLDRALDSLPCNWASPPLSIATLRDIAIDTHFRESKVDSLKEGLFYGPPATEARNFTDVSFDPGCDSISRLLIVLITHSHSAIPNRTTHSHSSTTISTTFIKQFRGRI